MQDNFKEIIFGLTLPQVIVYGAMAITAVIMLIYYMRSEKPVRSALLGMLSGAAALLIVNHFGGGALPMLPLNGFTAFIALTLGIPGVAAMAVLTLV